MEQVLHVGSSVNSIKLWIRVIARNSCSGMARRKSEAWASIYSQLQGLAHSESPIRDGPGPALTHCTLFVLYCPIKNFLVPIVVQIVFFNFD